MSEKPNGGYLPVKVNVPLDTYRLLNAEADRRGLDVADVIMQRVSPPKRGGRRPNSGRRSGYTSRAGEEITAGRRFNMSWPEISRKLGISEHTARTWAAKYENEVREQNARERAERNAG
ncbi:helix-turn-helix domain-containing protein [Streptomyces sp. AC495_CC817]|uniref:helix-turn-helix domain-containing protein n=1 Tax=Streptomyces sp. AC495_CC817 TaxID=2823900 RepID=UPI001C28080A|nr:helix-turn-helix domain-containing protein [Streptomyces sp. AC495_CC817]